MKQLICIIGLLLVNQISSFTTDWTTEFDYYTYLDEDELFRLYWNNLDNDIIEFGMEASATGWIALGISPNGQMPGSDIAIGWVDDDGEVYLQDRYTTGRVTPLYDSNQNLTLVEGEQTDGMTRIRFTRPKYTCNENDIQIAQGTTRLIWAFHETADPDEECFDSSSIDRHTNKGAQSLNLDTGLQDPVELESDIQYFDILMDEVSVPSTDTTYYCKLFKLPELATTHHVVYMEPIVQEGNEGAVHHLLAYQCDEWLIRGENDIGAEGICDHDFENMPAEECIGSTVSYAWAIGGDGMYFPEHVGLPIGGDSGFKYVMMEMHYDNPGLRSDIVDSSGFRMYYTAQLRELDAGIMSVGAWTNALGQYIPQGLEYAHTAAFMYPDCTEDIFPEDGINIFGTLLHQHTIGVASTLRHIRDGQELEPLDSNWNYDFNYQNTIIWDEPKILKGSDTVILDCYLDSSSRDFVTYGGESTREEMCFGFFWYYPYVDFLGAGVAKTEEALVQWMIDAQTNGYMTGNITKAWNKYLTGESDVLDDLYYDHTMDGSLEFYNRLWNPDYPEYDQNYLYCGGSNDTEIVFDVRPTPNNFTKYDANIFTCDGDTNGDDSVGVCVAGVKDNASRIGSMFIVIILGVVGFVFM